MEQCIICLESEGKILDYEHTCGKYKVHEKCMFDWLAKNNCECLVCRKKIITEEEEREIRDEYNIIVQPEPIIPSRQTPRQTPNYPVVVYQPRNYPVVDFTESNFNCICGLIFIIIFFAFFLTVLNSRT